LSLFVAFMEALYEDRNVTFMSHRLSLRITRTDFVLFKTLANQEQRFRNVNFFTVTSGILAPIHSSVICQTTGPQPLPKRFLHLMRSRASSFK
jgi:hypothetical protein